MARKKNPHVRSSQKFWVEIRWGSQPEEGDEPCAYEFDTKAELDAFLDGVDAAAGWLDYEIVRQMPD